MFNTGYCIRKNTIILPMLNTHFNLYLCVRVCSDNTHWGPNTASAVNLDAIVVGLRV